MLYEVITCHDDHHENQSLVHVNAASHDDRAQEEVLHIDQDQIDGNHKTRNPKI